MSTVTQTEIGAKNHPKAVRFFWCLLIGATTVSLIGNIANAVLSYLPRVVIQIGAATVPPIALLAVVHGETSTGCEHPLEALGAAMRGRETLLMADCVTSLGGAPLALDASGVDVAFSGSQKCLNCPPGLAPFTASERAMERLFSRCEPCRSWYLDLRAILAYCARTGRHDERSA